jgi:hypothetical protein
MKKVHNINFKTEYALKKNIINFWFYRHDNVRLSQIISCSLQILHYCWFSPLFVVRICSSALHSQMPSIFMLERWYFLTNEFQKQSRLHPTLHAAVPGCWNVSRWMRGPSNTYWGQQSWIIMPRFYFVPCSAVLSKVTCSQLATYTATA